MKLNAYFLKNIFEPLGLKNITMFPNEEMKSQLASMHQRWGSGKLEERDHLYRRPLMAETEEEQDRIFNSGGAGCFAKPAEYCRKPSSALLKRFEQKTQHNINTVLDTALVLTTTVLQKS